ncbi:MAG TPA: diguanylate cyclase [Anaeromyxobacteraceae bacterium]|nr:diguanylate cyclase [Anaeromyxobacteraceae bacterium]
MKVLLADDDLLLRRMLEPELRKAGWDVVTAGDGDEAWDAIQRERIRIAVVDWLMPGLDGAGLIRRIRAAGGPGYVYTILLTARDGARDVVEGLEAGADDYVTKPFRVEELLARLGVGSRILDLERRLLESLAREEALATRDGLTDLPNRRALLERARLELSRALRERGSLGVIMVDLDHFKEINDRFGHAAGDEALRRVAEALEKNRRDYDFGARWGGEEFVVLLPGATLEQAGGVAERIRGAIHAVELRVGEGASVRLRASLGVVAATPATAPVEVDDLLASADEAMYRAKREGRDRVVLASGAEPAPLAAAPPAGRA